jgi:hypothetical protein
MGLPIRNLYATRIENEILLSAWKPEKRKDGKYYRPDNTPIGLDMWVPNVFNLGESEGTVEVDIVPSNKDVGIYLFCFNDYFGNEQHIFTFKHKFKEGTKNIDWGYAERTCSENYWGLHVSCDIKTVAGDGPITITLTKK